MKITAEFISKSVPKIDHPVLNSIHNGQAGRIELPVTLYRGDEEQCHTNVVMLGTAMQQNMAALYLSLNCAKRAGLSLEWDRVQFLSGSAPWIRSEMPELDEDRLTKHLIADKNLPIYAVMHAAY